MIEDRIKLTKMIREMREVRNISLAEMAEFMSWKEKTYERFEAGKIDISVNEFVQIAEKLQMKLKLIEK